MRRLNHQQSSGYTVSDLWQEFCQLKEENERLRQETISMLKADSRGHRFSKNSKESSTVVYWSNMIMIFNYFYLQFILFDGNLFFLKK